MQEPDYKAKAEELAREWYARDPSQRGESELASRLWTALESAAHLARKEARAEIAAKLLSAAGL